MNNSPTDSQSNQDKDELAVRLCEVAGVDQNSAGLKAMGRVADFILARDSKLIQAVLGEVSGPEDKIYKKLEDCWNCQGPQYGCGCTDAFNWANNQWRTAINRLKKKYEEPNE